MIPDDSAMKRTISIPADTSDNRELEIELNDDHLEEDEDAISSTSSVGSDSNKNPVPIDVDAIVVEEPLNFTNSDNNIVTSSCSNQNPVPIDVDAIIVEKSSASSNNDENNDIDAIIVKKSSASSINDENNESRAPINVDEEVVESNDKILVTVGIENDITLYEEESDDDYQLLDYSEDDDQQTTTCDIVKQRNLVSHQITDPQQIQQLMSNVGFTPDGGVSVNGNIGINKGENIHIGNRIDNNFNAPPTVIYTISTVVKNDDKQNIEFRQHNGDRSNDNNTNENQTSERKPSISLSHQEHSLAKNKAIVKCFWTKRSLVSICIAAIILIIFTILILYSTGIMNSGSSSSSSSNQSNESPDDDYLEIVTRDDWRAKDPKRPPKKLEQLPSPYVIITHIITSFCYNKTQCIENVKIIQDYQMNVFEFDDIAYNFIVDCDGNIYEGRGWDIEGDHTEGYNSRSISVTFIGRFYEGANIRPTKSQVEAAYKLLEFGLKRKKLTPDYKLLGQRQVMNSTIPNPGDNLFRIIQQHDHWSATP